MTTSALCLAVLAATLAQPPSGLERLGRVITGSGEPPPVEAKVDPPTLDEGVDWSAMPWEEAAHRQYLHRLQYDLSEEVTRRRTEAHHEKTNLSRNPKPLMRSYHEARLKAFTQQEERTRKLMQLATKLEDQPINLETLRARDAAAALLRDAYLYSEALTEAKRGIATSELTAAQYEEIGKDNAATLRRGEKHRTGRAVSQELLDRAMDKAEHVIGKLGGTRKAGDVDDAVRLMYDMDVADLHDELITQRDRHERHLAEVDRRIKALTPHADKGGEYAQRIDVNRRDRAITVDSLAATKAIDSLVAKFKSRDVSLEAYAAWVACFDAAVRAERQVAWYSDLNTVGRISHADMNRRLPGMQKAYDALDAEAKHRRFPDQVPAPSPRPHAKLADRALGDQLMRSGMALSKLKRAIFVYEQQVPFAEHHLDDAKADLERAQATLKQLIDSPTTVDGAEVEAFAARPLARDVLYDALVPKADAKAIYEQIDELDAKLAKTPPEQSKWVIRLRDRQKYVAPTTQRFADRADDIAEVLNAVARGDTHAPAVALARLRQVADLYSDAEQFHYEQWLPATASAIDMYMTNSVADGTDAETYIRSKSTDGVVAKVWLFFEAHGNALHEAWPNVAKAVVSQ